MHARRVPGFQACRRKLNTGCHDAVERLRASRPRYGPAERDDDQAGDIVDAVAGRPDGYHAVGVLDDPDIVDQGEQMVGADLGTRGEFRPRMVGQVPLPAPLPDGSSQDVEGAAADRRPGEVGAHPSRLLSRFGHSCRVVQQVADGPGQGGDRRRAPTHRRPRTAGPRRSNTASTPPGSRPRPRKSAAPKRFVRGIGTA